MQLNAYSQSINICLIHALIIKNVELVMSNEQWLEWTNLMAEIVLTDKSKIEKNELIGLYQIIPIRVDTEVPKGEIQIRNNDNILGKIINLATFITD